MDHKLYLTDPGIFKNKNFYYTGGKPVTDLVVLKRLNKLKPPPAWENVWYASNKDCHIQGYGTDTSGKKQYILSENYINESRSEKYKNMKNFTRKINSFKKRIKLKNEIINRENLICLLFNLLIDTHIRVGNEIYAETNKTYGLTTLRQKHLKFEDNAFKFVFTGKSKIKHTILVPSEYNNFMKRIYQLNLICRNLLNLSPSILRVFSVLTPPFKYFRVVLLFAFLSFLRLLRNDLFFFADFIVYNVYIIYIIYINYSVPPIVMSINTESCIDNFVFSISATIIYHRWYKYYYHPQ